MTATTFTDSYYTHSLTCSDHGQDGDVLVEGHGRVKGNEAVEEGLAHARDDVPAHGEQEADVGEHDDTGGPPNHCRGPGAGQPAKSGVLTTRGVDCNNSSGW